MVKENPKVTERIPNNLKIIRKELGITQIQLAEMLKVEERTVRGYESKSDSDFINLPLDKAMCISLKYGYSLDYIYCNQDREYAYQNAFKYDIRHFITCDKDNVYFTVPLKYWDYIYEIMQINNSSHSEKLKAIEITEVAKKYSDYDENDIAFRISMPKDEFNSYVKVNSEFYPYTNADDSNANSRKPTDEELKGITEFFENL